MSGGGLLEQVLGLAIEVFLRFGFVTPIALDTTTEVVVLTLGADPTSIWEVELVGSIALCNLVLL